jgi:enterochelin esterase-like enzyme
MRSLRRGALLAAACLAVVLGAQTARGVRADDPRLLDIVVPSPGLGGSFRAVVVLPRDYGTSGKRYPVITFLHGLPAGELGYRGVGFLERALDQTGSEAIIVAPQGARKGDSDPEYLDWGPGRNWETAVSTDLRRYIDANYDTIADRSARALVGLSAGGYGAMLVALHDLQDFGVIESWSGYFHPTDPSGLKPVDLGSDAANKRASAHALISALQRDEQRRPTFVAFYVGNEDSRFRSENVLLHRELVAAGIGHTFAVYPGGHTRAVWQAHAAQWLGLAVAHLTPATAAPGVTAGP